MGDTRDSAWVVERLEPDRDLDAVLEIEAGSFSNPWTREMFSAEFSRTGISHNYVIRTPDHPIAGFCMIWVLFDEIHINNFAIRPACRRSGLGRALLRASLADARQRGGRRAALEVRRSNVGALGLYGQLGFRVAGVRRDYYTNPAEDALVLELPSVSL
jgi:[ribosomal protein S18]-alanine N-acetyltransferase